MLKVAIVGNIASGKSTVENIIQNKGFKVYDTDKIAHKILASNKDVIKKFGTNNRQEIAKIVFSNPEKLKDLESIIHPLVKIELENIFSSNEGIIFISVPQLFEAGFAPLFDKIIYITASKKIRLDRLMKRNSYTQAEALIRINAQKDKNKAINSHFVINNNGTISELEKKVQSILGSLKKI